MKAIQINEQLLTPEMRRALEAGEVINQQIRQCRQMSAQGREQSGHDPRQRGLQAAGDGARTMANDSGETMLAVGPSVCWQYQA